MRALQSKTKMIFAVLSALCLLQGACAPTTAELQKTIDLLCQQLSMQQLAAEERVRSDGDSGLKQIRHRSQGDRPYYGETHTGLAIASMHNHANFKRVAGMGEFVAVLNGVEFRTRHNDYNLMKPVTGNKVFHAVKTIPFPRVPPSVLKKATVAGQVAEMQQYFLAWKTQNPLLRNYAKFFKPILCYLEGHWSTDTGALVEPFSSDRHQFDADTWEAMHDSIQYTAYTGTKDLKENLGFLPTKIVKLTSSPVPVKVQWSYRILCHPLRNDLKLNRFRVAEDMANRQAYKHKEKDLIRKLSTRFTLNTIDSDVQGTGFEKYQLIDRFMAQVPGKDNYPGKLVDDSMGRIAYKFNGKAAGETVLNAARYHRMFSEMKNDAMGDKYKHRGFADENLFMAMNTQRQVLAMNMTKCTGRVCKSNTQRWSYAIPLEIIYLTPLSRWNPYKLKYHGDYGRPTANAVTAGGRNGGMTPETAFNGINYNHFSITPAEFFDKAEMTLDPADTTGEAVGVLRRDRKTVVRVRKSGIRIIMANIPGVGLCRQRWPIMPLHVNGNAIMKKVEAMRDHYHMNW